jgi:hypothetical protein
MKKRILLTVLMLTSIVVEAQNVLPIQYDTSFYKHEFILNGSFDYSSTSVLNSLSSKLLFGGEITDEIKASSFDQHKGINRFGLDASAEFEYRNMYVNLFKKERYGYVIKAGYYNYASTIYAKDLFGLTFFGNEPYLGVDADLSGSRFSAISFQKIGFGAIDKKSKSALSLNYYNFSNYAEGYLSDGYLFQSESGDSVSLTLDGQVDYSGSTSFMKGYGVGVDVDYRFSVMINPEKVAFIQLQAKNIGFAQMTSKITRYEVDTLLTFEGFTFDQLIGNANVMEDGTSILDTLGIDSLSVQKFRILPGYIQVGKIVDETSEQRLQGFFGVRLYTISTYAPLIFGGAHLRANSWLSLGLNASYGGFTRFRTGLYAQSTFKNMTIALATEDVIGLLSNQGKGKSVILRLRYRI